MTIEIDNTAFPYRTVVYIESRFPNGAGFTGSGVIVGRNDVLTAAHMVFDGASGGLATSIKVIPAYDPSPLEKPYGELFASVTNYFSDFDPDNDGMVAPGNRGPGATDSEIDYACSG
jgi:hypothetical protein